MKSFSEPSPVRLLVGAEPYVFSASERGMVRWEPRSGQSLQLSAEHGLPGDRVEAMTYDQRRGWLWVATDGGVTRYEVKANTFAELPDPPSVLGLGSFAGVSLAPAKDGGLWIGHKRGLYYTNPAGQWTGTGVREPVTSVLRTDENWLWIGAKSGLVARMPDGESYIYGPEQGCDITRVRFMTRAPGGETLIVGTNAVDEQRILLIVDNACHTYRSAPNERWISAAPRAKELVILTNKRLYSLRKFGTGIRSLSRDGMRLLPIAVDPDKPTPRSPYEIASLGIPLPSVPECMTALGDAVFVGTRHLGTARLRVDGRRIKRTWLRQSWLVQDASVLSVACLDDKYCYVATGAPQAWRYNSDGFVRANVKKRYPLAFARTDRGQLYALVRNNDEHTILLYRNNKGSWKRKRNISISVPGTLPQVTFARFSPKGRLWLGLRYRDNNGEEQPGGVAIVNLRREKISYYGDDDARDERGKRSSRRLDIPSDVSDVAFLGDDEVWLATSTGAIQIRDRKVTRHGESSGLPSEVMRGLTASDGGIVFVATRYGISAFDGDTWSSPKALKFEIQDVDIGQDGKLWMATKRGLASFDGSRVHWLDKRRGLLENAIRNIHVDHTGRVWGQGGQGIILITP